MSLRSDAVQLSKVLNEIVKIADGSGGSIAELAACVVPMVARYDHAVFDLRCRQEASDVLTEMADRMSDLSATATKLEIQGFGNRLDSYWRLHTIFRESRYRNEAL